jgi:hypothetical protein
MVRALGRSKVQALDGNAVCEEAGATTGNYSGDHVERSPPRRYLDIPSSPPVRSQASMLHDGTDRRAIACKDR